MKEIGKRERFGRISSVIGVARGCTCNPQGDIKHFPGNFRGRG